MKTENKIVLPIVLLMIAAAIMGCKTEPELCALGAHLGIGESCSGNSCTLQDYNTNHAAFPKEIFRVGAVSKYTPSELSTTANNIVTAYSTGMGGNSQTAMKNIGKIAITKAANEEYTWNGTILGVHVNLAPGDIRGLVNDIYGNNLPLVQILQAVNTIRLAAGKDSDTEQLPVLAGGAAKEPKLGTVAKNFTKLTRAVRLRDSNLAKGIATRSRPA